MAQEVRLRMIERPNTKQNTHQCAIDVCREWFGRPESALSRVTGTIEIPAGADSWWEEFRGPLTQDALDNHSEAEERLKVLTPSLRAAFILYVVQGLNLKELGYVFGVTEGCMSQRLKEARALLQSH